MPSKCLIVICMYMYVCTNAINTFNNENRIFLKTKIKN